MEVVCRQAYRGFKNSMLLRLETARTSIAKLDRQHVDAVSKQCVDKQPMERSQSKLFEWLPRAWQCLMESA